MIKARLFFLASGMLLLGACSCISETPAPLSSQVKAPEGAFDQSHQVLDGLVSKYVKPEGIDYKGLAEEVDQLDLYLAGMQAVQVEDFATWSREQRFAFWINAYNGYILRFIVANYPLDSIRDMGGLVFNQVWDHELIPLSHLAPDIDNELLSFNDVEHVILRPTFKDARVHAAVNCASKSCPPLATEAFVADRLDAQLETMMTAFIADTTRNQLDSQSGRIEVSSIFDWFGEDFVRDAGGVREYVKRYAGAAGGAWIDSAKVSFLDYSWDLNDASE